LLRVMRIDDCSKDCIKNGYARGSCRVKARFLCIPCVVVFKAKP